VVLHRGQVLADGTPEEIHQNKDVRNVYLGEGVLWEKI
jgi:ABC-type branched-subunit amino acid transport system ATPase component